MRKSAQLALVLGILAAGLAVRPAEAVTKVPTVTETPEPTITIEATPTLAEKSNIAEPGNGETKYRLESVLEKNRVGKWNGVNTIRKSVQAAVDRGVSANTIVLLLLLPLVATVVSVLHYVVGLSGYGIFMPTMMAVAMLATGIPGGLILFGVILGVSLLSNAGLRKLKLHFWPSRAINLTFISVVTFGMMVVTSYLRVIDLSKISIFPVLFVILLVEEFVRTQLARSKGEAIRLTVGTLALAMIGTVGMSIRGIQEWVIVNPEWTLLIVIVVNIVVGNYTGIRWLEVKRFGKAIRKKKG